MKVNTTILMHLIAKQGLGLHKYKKIMGRY